MLTFGSCDTDTNQTRVVKKAVPTDSFFNFFTPPQVPDEDASEIEDDIDEKLELDYQIGEDLKERVIPKAISFFDGSINRQEPDFSSDEFDEDEDLEEDEDDSDDEEGAPRGGSRRAPQPPSGATPASQQDPQECKQS